jgi:hypothetical protein
MQRKPFEKHSAASCTRKDQNLSENALLMQAPDNGEQALRSEGDRAKGLTWRRYTREHENLR